MLWLAGNALGGVVIDPATGGLIVDGRPFLPFGFFTDWDQTSRQPEEEVVNAFNLISPRWSVGRAHTQPEKDDIQAFLDRCAAVGLRVNYALDQITQFGTEQQMLDLLTDEINEFQGHPAILTWYLAEDPQGHGLSVARMETAYNHVKTLDLNHPVTVMIDPEQDITPYLNSFDIVMINPTAVPDQPMTYVADKVDAALAATGTKPVWTVPQAFGGNENWLREPTMGEMRAQTWLSLIHGSRGIQYFKRREPSGFPKSTLAWAACQRAAMETSLLVPAFLSTESPPTVTCVPSFIEARSYLDRGLLTIVAVNTQNQAVEFSAQIAGSSYTGQADVPFEYRQLNVQNGAIAEPIEAHGRRVYQIAVGPMPVEDIIIDPSNLMINPSWETMVNPGAPANCYLGRTGDFAVTAILDPIEARHGRYSLRLVTPTSGQGMIVYPFNVPTVSGTQYRASVWAKSDRLATSFDFWIDGDGAGSHVFSLTQQWQEYEIVWTPSQSNSRTYYTIDYNGPGMAWFDVMQIVPQ